MLRSSPTGLEHARLPHDEHVLHVPLMLPPEDAAAAAAEQQRSDNTAHRCDASSPNEATGFRRRRRGGRRAAAEAARSVAARPPPWWCDSAWQQRLTSRGVTRIDASAGLGLLPVHQFGSFLATRVVREAALYGARPFCLHATHIVGSGITFTRNNLKSMGPCTHPVWCLGGDRVSAASLKALTLRQYGLWALADAPDYHHGRFLSYSNNPARRLRRFRTHANGDAQWGEHLALLQEQLHIAQACPAESWCSTPAPPVSFCSSEADSVSAPTIAVSFAGISCPEPSTASAFWPCPCAEVVAAACTRTRGGLKSRSKATDASASSERKPNIV